MTGSLERTVRTGLRLALGILLLWAAVSKLAHLQEFHDDLSAYRLPLSDAMARGMTAALLWIELGCGLLLLSGYQLRKAALCSLILFSLFAVATGQAWARGLEISCGCFDFRMIGLSRKGSIARFFESTGFAFVRALLLAAAAWYLWHRAKIRTDSAPR